jgi:hypothetical protein
MVLGKFSLPTQHIKQFAELCIDWLGAISLIDEHWLVIYDMLHQMRILWRSFFAQILDQIIGMRPLICSIKQNVYSMVPSSLLLITWHLSYTIHVVACYVLACHIGRSMQFWRTQALAARSLLHWTGSKRGEICHHLKGILGHVFVLP